LIGFFEWPMMTCELPAALPWWTRKIASLPMKGSVVTLKT
jgi:hypothetical protein